MSLSRVKQALSRMNLNFDSTMTDQVCVFLAENNIRTDQTNIQLMSIVAAAIISEIKLVPSIGDKGFTNYGVCIETVMSHLKGYSKQDFLDRVFKVIQKNTTLANKLFSKVKNVQLSYRLFKKYRKSFQQLWPLTGISSLVMNDMLSIFWVIYLLVKNEKQDIYEDVQQQTKLLIVLLKSIFESWISNINFSVVQSIISKNFQLFNCQLSQQYFTLRNDQYYKEMQKLYKIRYMDQSLELKRFSRNPIRIARFLDDISNFFFKEKECFEVENYIDEISYLQLQKSLAPNPIKKKVEKDLPVISLTLAFSNRSISESNQQKQLSSQQKQNLVSSSDKSEKIKDSNSPIIKPINNFIISQNLTDMTPCRERKDFVGATPCHNRIENMEWVRNCLDYMNRLEASQIFKKAFSLVERESLSAFEAKARKQLLYLVEEFIPKCRKKDKRVNDMFVFFKFWIIKIYEKHQEGQNIQMFKEIKTFSAILCLSTDIFNFIHSSFVSSFKEQCEIFDVPLIEGLKPINWIGKNIDKPHEVSDYLYLLEKRIVIQQIWYDQTGYNLVRSQQSFYQSYSIGYNDMIVWKRLKKHIFDRIEELSKEVKIEPKLTKKIHDLQQRILKQKPFLLHKNKIDHIVICCITAFLSFNQIEKKRALNKVFQGYNNIDLSSNASKDGLSGNGLMMSLDQYYNNIFLPEVQDLFNTDKASTSFYLTPIRKDLEKISISKSQQTPFSRKYQQNRIDYFQPSQKLNFPFSSSIINETMLLPMLKIQANSPVSRYRTKLLLKTHKMEEQNENENKNKNNGNSKNIQQEKFSHRQPIHLIMQNGNQIHNNLQINHAVKEE